ncbi:MAG: hypothetical protein QOH64_3472 [Acidimicrobiaceae bacterium]
MANDPHGLGAAYGRLGSGGRKAGKASTAAVGVLLRDGEVVECVVQGQIYGANAVAVLTNARLLIVNDREFKPDIIDIALDPSVTVQGWQDDRTASLLIQQGASSAQLERIADRPLAMELAQRIRARAV